MKSERTILWRRLDQPGHEAAKLMHATEGWHIAGTAVLKHEEQPCLLNYYIECDERWETKTTRVDGWVGNRIISVEVAVNPDRQWSLNGEECEEVAGCIDVDLNFSPVTNLLPIRRLNLGMNKQDRVRAAWLRFPSFRLEPLEQIYRRLSNSTYRYESAGGKFVRELRVDDVGMVTLYPDFWQAETSA
jgi:uncharacterized protein